MPWNYEFADGKACINYWSIHLPLKISSFLFYDFTYTPLTLVMKDLSLKSARTQFTITKIRNVIVLPCWRIYSSIVASLCVSMKEVLLVPKSNPPLLTLITFTNLLHDFIQPLSTMFLQHFHFSLVITHSY